MWIQIVQEHDRRCHGQDGTRVDALIILLIVDGDNFLVVSEALVTCGQSFANIVIPVVAKQSDVGSYSGRCYWPRCQRGI